MRDKIKKSNRKTKFNYEKYLNENSPEVESESWIIGGKRRERLAANQKYGTALKLHDPIAFQVGYNDWKLK